MQRSVEAGQLETIDCNTIIDGLRVRRAGELNFSVVQRFVDEIVALPDRGYLRGDDLGDGAVQAGGRGRGGGAGGGAAARLVKLPAGSRVAAVLSGGNVNLDQLRGLTWN